MDVQEAEVPRVTTHRHDPARLAALRATGLLDTEAEPAFDRLARLAVAVLGVPAAFLSLVDAHRDFYKAAVGLGDPLATTRELTGPTLCHHAIAGTGPLVIPDTAADPRYRDVPTVQSLGVAAYLGVPLVVDGQAIGSLCAIDTAPHAWTATEVDVLSELAASALREIALRQAYAMSEERAEELERANLQLQEQAAELELQAEELQATSEQLAERTDAAEQAERRLEAAFAQAPAAIAVTSGAEHRFVLANAEYAVLVGRPVRTGQTFTEALPEVAAQGYAALLDRVYATGEPHVAHAAHALVDKGAGAPVEGWYDFVYQPLVDGAGRVSGVMQLGIDVTAQVRARHAIETLNGELGAANAALGASETRYRALFESLDAGFCIVELLFDDGERAVDYRFLETNPAFVVQTGLAGAAGRTVRELVPGVEDHWIETYGRVATTGEPVRFEQGSDAMQRWFDVYAFRVGAPEARTVALLFTDVTAAKAAEQERERLLGVAEALRADAELARARLSEVFHQAPALIVVLHGPDHVIELANREYQQIAGHRELLGKPLREAMPEVVDQGFIALLDGVLATGESFHGREVPVRLAPATGVAPEERFVSFVYQALVETDGRRSGVFVHGIDVTESVRARQAVEATAAALAASEARYRTLTDAVPVQVWTARPDGLLDFVSERTAAYLGAPAGRVLGSGWGAFVHPDDLPAAVSCWSESLATGAPYQTEFRLRAADGGDYRWHLVRALPERDAAGRVTGWVGTNTDVDDVRRARAEAEEARAAAERANQAKAEFLATMSHELRTPLNAIGGYAELMEMGVRGPVTEEQRHDLGRVRQSQRHLLGLVNEVLDLAKVDAGELRVESAVVRAGDTVDAALALVRPQAAARALALSDRCGGAADQAYLGDEPRVRQVLVNLLSNAVKFTAPGGRVAVACDTTDTPPAGSVLVPGAPYLAFRVEDTGSGIPADQCERIFEPFTQVESGASAYARPAGGTGLGLAISRRLARLMGGDLTLESREGVGSTFTLWLPTPEARATPRTSGAWPGAGGEAARAATPRDVPSISAGLASIGIALAAEVGPTVRAWVGRLRADPGLPVAGRTDEELEDHMATFVTDIGLGLRAFAARGEAAALLRDSRAILSVLAERHGAQRARLGWTEAALRREFALLAEVLDAAVSRLAGPADAAAAARAGEAVRQFLAQAERVSLGGFRVSASTGAAG